MDEFGVTHYRAVATSATREAANRKAFVTRIRVKSGIRLEVISALEESRLGREGVFAALGPETQARCIADLGGGSLEISVLQDHSVLKTAQLPVGTVRLMTTLNIHGEMRPTQAEQVRRYLRALLESKLPTRPNLADGLNGGVGGQRRNARQRCTRPAASRYSHARTFLAARNGCLSCCAWTFVTA